MLIGALQKVTLQDYLGEVACIVFTVGCNWRCPFCHSAELVLPEKIKNQPIIPEEEIMDFLKSRKGLLSGVVICGGEPTIQPDLKDFIIKVKKMGFKVKLDSNGSNPLDEFIPLVDYIAMDIKDSKRDVKKNIELIMNSGVDYEFRSTIVPVLHSEEEILKMAELIKGAKRYYLQNFRPGKTLDPEFEKIEPYSFERLEEIKDKIKHLFGLCQVR